MSIMSEHFFRAVRDFVFVHLPLYLRAFAIFLIFASPYLLVDLGHGRRSRAGFMGKGLSREAFGPLLLSPVELTHDL
jgi:hypothetical protein